MKIAGALNDIRYAARILIKNKTFTLIAMATLAVGSGSCIALFSVVNAVLLRPLPYDQPDALVKMWETRPRVPKGRVSWADYVDWKAQSHGFDWIAAYRPGDYNLTGNGDAEQVQGAAITAGLLEMLRIPPQFGRTFSSEDDKSGAPQVVVLSHGLWQRRYGADASLIGKSIRIDDTQFQVVGIMPAGFFFPDLKTELWQPLAINQNSRMAGRNMHILDVIGRLRQGVRLEQSRAEMRTIASHLERAYPRENTGHGADAVSLLEDWTGAYRTNLLLIFGAVGFVLLIACANVATLLLSRSAQRRKEVAIRIALGAGRGRIVAQLLAESTILSLLGTTLGLAFAYWLLKGILLVTPANVFRMTESTLTPSVLAFAIGTAIVSGVLLGAVPALHLSTLGDAGMLKDTSRGATASATSSRLRNVFAVVEVSLAAMLLAGSGLLLKSFLAVERIDPGFNSANVLTANISLQSFRPAQRQVFVDEVLDRVRSQGGVVAAAAVTHLPLTGAGPSFDFQIAGRQQAPTGEEFKSQLRCATPDYFRALGILLRSGRVFTPQDSADAPKVVAINEEMARRYWPNESPLGQRISFDQSPNGTPAWREIVGIVRGIRHSSLESEPEPQMYTPFGQFSMPFAALVIRTAGDPLAFSRSLRSAVAAVNPNEPVSAIRSMQQVVEQAVASRRFNVLMIAFFASIAMLVASIGVYGVLAYTVTQRRAEMGIRLALGSGRGEVVWLVLKHGLGLVICGICAGTLGAWSIMRLLSTQLYRVSASDPLVFSTVTILLLGVAMAASYVPAWRASRVDPAMALRSE